MYLKSLTLKGFKSFADKTEMIFDPGLTVVVGPNGSGKSNVSDAMLWVLGEQGPRNLRAQAMEDVIFAGSSKRDAVSFAEVTLVLNNSDHTLPIDFADVAITRRMYRSGESEYLINGAAARLRDINDILHDSGLGKETHSIISQGKLDAILVSKPQDRRDLIEEAAGIAKHRRRKKLAEKKLELMATHLNRIKDVKREIHKQLLPLEKQMGVANRARELTSVLQRSKTMCAVDDLSALKARYEQLSSELKEANASVELLEFRKQEAQKSLESYRVLLEQKGLFVGDLSEQRRRLHDIAGRMDSDMRLLEEKGKNMVKHLSELRRNMSAQEHTKQDLLKEKQELMDSQAESHGEIEFYLGSLAEKEPQLASAKSKRMEYSRTCNSLNDQVKHSTRQRDALQISVATLEERLKRTQTERALFSERLGELEDTIKQNEQAQAALDEKMTSTSAQLKEKTEELSQNQHVLDEASAQKAAASTQKAELDRKLFKIRGELVAKTSQVEAAQHASQRLSYVKKTFSPDILATFLDVCRVPTEYETLVEAYLSDVLSMLIVKDTNSALHMMTSCSSQKGRLVLYPMPALTDTDVQTAHDKIRTTYAACGTSLFDALDVNASYKSILFALTGTVFFADTLQHAYELHKKYPELTFISKDGSCLYADGRCVSLIHTVSVSMLALKRTIRSLNEQEKDIQTKQDACAATISSLDERISALSTEVATLRQTTAQLNGESSSLARERERIQKNQQLTQEQLSRLKTKQQSFESDDKLTREKLQKQTHELKEVTAQVESLHDTYEESVQKRNETSRLENRLEKEVSELKLKLVRAQERKNHRDARSARIDKDLALISQTISEYEQSAFTLDRMRYRVEPLYNLYQQLLELVQAWSQKLKSSATLAEADSASLKKTVAEARTRLDKSSSELEHAKTQESNLRVEQTRLEVEVKHALTQITEFGYSLDDALDLPHIQDRSLCERQIAHIEAELNTLGPINSAAPENYEATKKRYEYISSQIEDLESARQSLKKITRAIEHKMKEQFLQTFKQVNQNFVQIFSILFPGGSAHLELCDQDSIQDAGLEIIAQPQGKKIRNMMLMSGGEKSLCALALLFAVYKTRTVPFYVFDEIEAALDDANLSKLLHAIDELKKTTQLIVISHQRRTMEEADVLYGVSMHADGVSHVVSQRLRDALQTEGISHTTK